MKATIIILSAIFCFFLYGFLDVYIPRDTALYLSIALFLGILAGMTTPVKDEHRFDDIDIVEVGSDRYEQDKRIEKTRIASQKRKLYKSKKSKSC